MKNQPSHNSKSGSSAGAQIREHYRHRTTAPQPLVLITGVVWGIVLICLKSGSQPRWAWAMVASACLLTLYVAVRLWKYVATRR